MKKQYKKKLNTKFSKYSSGEKIKKLQVELERFDFETNTRGEDNNTRLPRIVMFDGKHGVTYSNNIVNKFYRENKHYLSDDLRDENYYTYTIIIQLNMYYEITENKAALVDDLSNDLVSFDVFEDVMEKFRDLTTSINQKIRKLLKHLDYDKRSYFAELNNFVITDCSEFFHPKIENLILSLENEIKDI